MHPAQAGLGGVGGAVVWWLRLAQSVWMRRRSAVPVAPGTGAVIVVIVARLAISHLSQAATEQQRTGAAWGAEVGLPVMTAAAG
jgi:hypothetical protein